MQQQELYHLRWCKQYWTILTMRIPRLRKCIVPHLSLNTHPDSTRYSFANLSADTRVKKVCSDGNGQTSYEATQDMPGYSAKFKISRAEGGKYEFCENAPVKFLRLRSASHSNRPLVLRLERMYQQRG